jgi:hypothetical protein
VYIAHGPQDPQLRCVFKFRIKLASRDRYKFPNLPVHLTERFTAAFYRTVLTI